MNINPITTFIKVSDNVGKSTISWSNHAIGTIKNKGSEFIKKDVFQKALKHKETIVGTAVLVSGLVLSVACIKKVANKIKETINKK